MHKITISRQMFYDEDITYSFEVIKISNTLLYVRVKVKEHNPIYFHYPSNFNKEKFLVGATKAINYFFVNETDITNGGNPIFEEIKKIKKK